MKFKKLIALGLCVLMATVGLAGCGNSGNSSEEANGNEPAVEETSEEKVITVFHYMGQTVKQDALLKLEEAYSAEHPGVTFENIFYNQGTDYFPQLSTALASGEQPDIIMGNASMYPDLIENGYAMDLTETDLIKNLEVDQYDINDVSLNGVTYAVPIDFKTSGIFYNVKIFEEQGLKVPTTRTEMNEVIEKLHNAGIDPFIDVYAEGSTGDLEMRCTVWPKAIAAGDYDIFEKWMSGEAKVADYPYIDEALSIWDDRMTYPRTDAMANNQDKALELFISGEGAMLFTGNWNIGELDSRGKELGFEFDFFVPPVDDNPDSAKMGVLTDQCFMVNPNADAVEDALGFLEYWVTDGALTWSEGTMMPMLNGVSSDKQLPVVKTMAEIKASGQAVSQGAFTKPLDTEFTSAWRKALTGYAESVVTGNPMTHEECIENIQALFDDIIATR